jgi:hypothetical protein
MSFHVFPPKNSARFSRKAEDKVSTGIRRRAATASPNGTTP